MENKFCVTRFVGKFCEFLDVQNNTHPNLVLVDTNHSSYVLMAFGLILLFLLVCTKCLRYFGCMGSQTKEMIKRRNSNSGIGFSLMSKIISK